MEAGEFGVPLFSEGREEEGLVLACEMEREVKGEDLRCGTVAGSYREMFEEVVSDIPVTQLKACLGSLVVVVHSFGR